MPRSFSRSVFLLTVSSLSTLVASAAPPSTSFFPPVPQTVSTVPGNGDTNPYGVAIVPPWIGMASVIQPGDVLISNFNNTTEQGLGSTIVLIRGGVQSLFYTAPAAAGWTGGLVLLNNGIVVAGSLPTTDGTDATVQPGGLFFISPNGVLLQQLVDTNAINGPWGLAVAQDGGDHASVFVANVLTGTIERYDLRLSSRPASFQVLQHFTIGSGFSHRLDPSAIVLGPAGLAYSWDTDTLYITSSTDNAVYTISNARETTANNGTGTLLFSDMTHLHGPVSIVIAPNGDLLISNSDGSNVDNTHPSEIAEFTPTGTFVSQFSIDPNTGGSFGIGLLQVGNGVVFAAVDDNTATATVWNTILFSTPQGRNW